METESTKTLTLAETPLAVDYLQEADELDRLLFQRLAIRRLRALSGFR